MRADVNEPVPSVSAVTVAMLTYRRPDDLMAAVPAVLEQFEEVDLPVRLLVVDNDPDAGAAECVAALSHERLEYVHEPSPGIVAARNRAMTETPARSLLIFIDDDERPTDGWLAALVATFRRYPCAAVVGPVISRFDGPVDDWISAGRFFDRRRMPTGTHTDVAATNNLLLDLDRVRALGLQFDEAFGQSGGSDTLFTRQLARAGGAMVWCDEAIVFDVVPASRLTRDWVLHRAFRSGNSWTRTSLALSTTASERWLTRLDALGRGGVRIAAGLARFSVGWAARSKVHQARGLRTCARGCGLAAAAVGYHYHEYRRESASGLRRSTGGPASDRAA